MCVYTMPNQTNAYTATSFYFAGFTPLPPHLFRGFMQNCFETVEAATRIFRQQQFGTREGQTSGWNSPASMPDPRSTFGRFSREVIARHFCCSCRVYVCLLVYLRLLLYLPLCCHSMRVIFRPA